MEIIRWKEKFKHVCKFCYQNICSEELPPSEDGFNIDQIVKAFRLNDRCMYRIYFYHVRLGEVNKVTDYKGIWGLSNEKVIGEKMESGNYNTRYGRMYYGVTSSQDVIKELRDLRLNSVIVFVPRDGDIREIIDYLRSREYDFNEYCYDDVLGEYVSGKSDVSFLRSNLNFGSQKDDFHFCNAPIDFNPTLVICSLDVYSN